MFACPELPSHLSGGAHKLAPNIHKTTVNGHFYRNNCIFLFVGRVFSWFSWLFGSDFGIGSESFDCVPLALAGRG